MFLTFTDLVAFFCWISVFSNWIWGFLVLNLWLSFTEFVAFFHWICGFLILNLRLSVTEFEAFFYWICGFLLLNLMLSFTEFDAFFYWIWGFLLLNLWISFTEFVAFFYWIYSFLLLNIWFSFTEFVAFFYWICDFLLLNLRLFFYWIWGFLLLNLWISFIEFHAFRTMAATSMFSTTDGSADGTGLSQKRVSLDTGKKVITNCCVIRWVTNFFYPKCRSIKYAIIVFIYAGFIIYVILLCVCNSLGIWLSTSSFPLSRSSIHC